MKIIDHSSQPREEWRDGVTTRMHVSAQTGAMQLTIFEQWCAPGLGAPTHRHTVEEVLSVIEGQAEIWAGDERAVFSAGQSVVVPAGQRHGFLNSGQEVLHMRFTLAAPIFEGIYDGRDEPVRRWVAEQDRN